MSRDQLAAIMAESLRLLRLGEQPAAVQELAKTLERLEAEDAARDEMPPPQWSAAAYIDDCPF